MTSTSPARLADADARSRAARTLLQGLILDVLAAVVLVLTPALTDVHWTRAYWAALGGLVVKSALQAALAWAMRKLVPPAV